MELTGLIFAALSSAKKANERIDNLPFPMVFKGTLGTGGTISTLPTASSENEGFVYIVITDGTYAGQSAKAGDTFVSDGSSWVLVPSGDEPSVIDDSVTSTALTWSSKKISDECKIKSFTYTGIGTSSNHRIDLPNDCKMILLITPNSITPTGTYDYTRLENCLPILPSGAHIECRIGLYTINGTTISASALHIDFYEGYLLTTAATNSTALNLNVNDVVYTVYYI